MDTRRILGGQREVTSGAVENVRWAREVDGRFAGAFFGWVMLSLWEWDVGAAFRFD
jgi:hypothetical protein